MMRWSGIRCTALLVVALASGACATGQPDYWSSPELTTAPIPTRQEVVAVLPAHATLQGDGAALARVAEEGFISQLEHATVVVAGAPLKASLLKFEVKDPSDRLGQAMAHAAFVENTDVISGEFGDATASLLPLSRAIDAAYPDQAIRWMAVLRIEELPSAKDMQARLQITAGLWDRKRNALASVVRFERYAEEGKLGGTARVAGIDAASRLTLDMTIPVETPADPPPAPPG